MPRASSCLQGPEKGGARARIPTLGLARSWGRGPEYVVDFAV